MQDPDFSQIIDLICKEDDRFAKKAYDFVRQGLDATVKDLRKKDANRGGRAFHVTGPELLDGLRTYSLEQFGPLAKTVLNSWGIKRCRDFGDIVFNLIEYNVFSKNENDRREDFSDIYSFDDAFVKPFLPKARLRRPGASPTAAPEAA
ncbi:MAG: Minf_1886 family protein [Opitutales bacterium]